MTHQKTVAAGAFKANCLKLMDEVNTTHQPVIITKFGKPIAQLVPLNNEPVDCFGCLSDSVVQEGDLVSPIEVVWDVQGE